MSKTKNHKFSHYLLMLFLIIVTNLWGQKINADDLFLAARKAAVEKKFSQAAKYCEESLEKNPLDMDVKELLGKCYMELGRLQEARIVLLQVLETSPKRVDARHYLLNIETESERYSSAICYANELLEITPYSKTLWLKKAGLYRLMNNDVEANRAIKRLYHIFPEDDEVMTIYQNSLKENALNLAKGQDHIAVAKQYEEILKINNKDSEAYLNLINAQIRLGNYNSALQTAEKGNYYLPENEEIFIKRISVLELQHEYQKAIDLVRAERRRAPSVNLVKLENYLLSESATYYKNSDPFELYSQIYARSKTNGEAYNYLLSTSLSRGYWGSAENLINDGLKRKPDSKELLLKQLFLYEMQQNEEGQRSVTAKLFSLYPADKEIIEKYDYQSFREAKVQLENKNYKAASEKFIRLLNHPELGLFASNHLIDIYAAQGLFEKAHLLADEVIIKDTIDVNHKLKKIQLYTLDNKYEQAYDYLQACKVMYPKNPQIDWMETDFLLRYNKYLIENEEFNSAENISNEIIQRDSTNKIAHLYKISAQLNMRHIEDALTSIEVALVQFPEDRDLKLKLADVYANTNRIDQSIQVLDDLATQYSYNQTIKKSLIEALFKKAKIHEEKRENEEAKLVYYKILKIDPNDTLSVIKIATILMRQDKLQDADNLLDEGLAIHASHNELLFLKGMIALRKEDYAKALEYMTLYVPSIRKMEEHAGLIDFIKSKLLKNQINVSYLRIRSDTLFLTASIATLEYLRIEKRNTLVGRINYAARSTGIGLQGEVDWYHTFENKSNFMLSAGVANQFFQPFKASASFFQPFKKHYQAELGARYIRQKDNSNLVAAVVGIERYYDRLWLNAKATVLTNRQNFYSNIFAQTRISLRNERNYITAMASMGTAPEDQKLDFQINTFTSFVNTMVGAGYFHNFNYYASAGIQGNWYTFRVSPERYVNQFNLYLTVRVKF